MSVDLFTPLSLRETTVPNRMMVSPMCQYSCENWDGRATDWHAQHLMSRAVGGITTPEQADALVRNGRADLAIIGRKHLRDPYFTIHAARQLGREDAVSVPSQYDRAF